MRLSSVLAAGACAATLVLLPGCGGGSDDSSASGSSSSGSAAAASGSPDGDDVTAFCTEAGSVFSDLSTAFDGATDPTQLPALLQQATSSLQAIDPPAEIEGSWNGFAGALGQLASAAQDLDLSTAEGQDQFVTQYNSLMSDSTAAQDDVDQFVTAHCPAAASSSSSPAG